VEVLVGEDSGDEESGFFDAEELGGAGEHGWFIRDRGGDRSRVTAKGEADSFAALRNDKQKNCNGNGNGKSRSRSSAYGEG
jgi:hypothetical protein